MITRLSPHQKIRSSSMEHAALQISLRFFTVEGNRRLDEGVKLVNIPLLRKLTKKSLFRKVFSLSWLNLPQPQSFPGHAHSSPLFPIPYPSPALALYPFLYRRSGSAIKREIGGRYEKGVGVGASAGEG